MSISNREPGDRPRCHWLRCGGRRGGIADAGIPLTLRMQEGYDHSYFFIATFMDDHLRHHARILED